MCSRSFGWGKTVTQSHIAFFLDSTRSKDDRASMRTVLSGSISLRNGKVRQQDASGHESRAGLTEKETVDCEPCGAATHFESDPLRARWCAIADRPCSGGEVE